MGGGIEEYTPLLRIDYIYVSKNDYYSLKNENSSRNIAGVVTFIRLEMTFSLKHHYFCIKNDYIYIQK